MRASSPSSIHACLLALAAVGCAAQSATPPATAPAAAQPARPADTAAPSPEPGEREDSTSQSNDVASALPEAPAVGTGGWDFHAWAYERGLKVELEADGCRPANLGDKPADVVWCDHHADSVEGALLRTQALYVARGQRLVKLVELPVAVGPTVIEDERAPAGVLRVKLAVQAAADGRSIELREADGFSCDAALRDNDETKVTAPAAFRAFDVRIRKVCAARGRWLWRAGTLQHAGK